MRILVDYSTAISGTGGIRRYTRNLVDALLREDPDDQFTLFSAGKPTKTYGFPDMPNARAVVGPLGARNMTRLWHRLRVPLPIEALAGAADIVHAPDFSLPPVARARTVVTIHDLTFITQPECSVPSLREFLLRTVPDAVRRADQVIADSQRTADDLVKILGAPREKITPVYLGVDPALKRVTDTGYLREVAARYGVGHPFALAVGTIEPRKNYERLIQAFAKIAGRPGAPAQLVIAGARGWLYDGIYATLERARLGSSALILESVSDRELSALYSMASIHVTPSLYEGFGLPPIEAMAYGVPVIVSDGGSLPEVVGDAGVIVPATDVDALAEAMVRVTSDGPLRADLIQRGRARLKLFSWPLAARATLDVYRRALQ